MSRDEVRTAVCADMTLDQALRAAALACPVEVAVIRWHLADLRAECHKRRCEVRRLRAVLVDVVGGSHV